MEPDRARGGLTKYTILASLGSACRMEKIEAGASRAGLREQKLSGLCYGGLPRAYRTESIRPAGRAAPASRASTRPPRPRKKRSLAGFSPTPRQVGAFPLGFSVAPSLTARQFKPLTTLIWRPSPAPCRLPSRTSALSLDSRV